MNLKQNQNVMTVLPTKTAIQYPSSMNILQDREGTFEKAFTPSYY